MKRVGILGGGQLGMLLSQSIQRLGAESIIYDPDPAAPACHCARNSINAAWDDKEALSAFFQQCDVVTYEFENVPCASLKEFERDCPIYPSLSVLEKTQNRILEKSFLRENGLPYVNFATITEPSQVQDRTAGLTFPVIAKSATGGYDGKFQYLLNSKEELLKLAERFTKTAFAITIEEVVDLHWELSCLTARNADGHQIAFPVLQNKHINHILDTTSVPAEIPRQLEAKLLEISLEATNKFQLTGLLCTEFFVAKSDSRKVTGSSCGDFTIYINEFAPRPHNSGHVTASACSFSQFEALARVLLDVPLQEPRILAPGYFCMGNLLGDIWMEQNRAPQDDLDLSILQDHKEIIDVVIYGKQEAKTRRKMGHLIAHSASLDGAKRAVNLARNALSQNRTAKITQS